MDAPLLLPTPRSLRPNGEALTLPEGLDDGEAPLLGAGLLRLEEEDGLPSEGYRLRIGTAGIAIATADIAGRRHALATLAQLRRQYGDRLPGLAIEDAPAFTVRGVMLDISRDRIPTLAELERLVDRLAGWKVNQLQLYVEHVVAYRGHQAAWRGCSPLTLDELSALDARCRERGINLVANQNCLGHLSGFLRLPGYAHLAEIAPGQAWEFGRLGRRQGPFSLCPLDPGSLALVEDLLGQLLPRLPAPWANLGCDESYDLGQGRSQEAVARRGRAAVYLDWVDRVCAIARRHGKRPLIWADIALEHPEALARLPEDLVGLAWGYEGDSDFPRWCGQLAAAGRACWVCPGTSAWRSLVGRTAVRRANLLAAARCAGRAAGFLVTEWGDCGHRQQWPIALAALAEAAHRAWSGEAPYDPRAGGLHAFACPDLGPWLDALGDCDAALRDSAPRPGDPGRRLANASALFTDLHLPLAEAWHGTAADWEAVDGRLADLERSRPAVADPQLARECRHSAAIAALAARRAAARRRGDAAALRSLAPLLDDLISEHRLLWCARSRFGGLAASCAHHLAVLADLRSAA